MTGFYSRKYLIFVVFYWYMYTCLLLYINYKAQKPDLRTRKQLLTFL